MIGRRRRGDATVPGGMGPPAATCGPGADGVEVRARRLLAAYPWRMRAEQGDEIVATVLDALPAGATRLPWRTAVDLVRGGLRVRRQRRPPFLTWLAFGLGKTIHPRWIWWVFDYVEHPRYRWRFFLQRLLPLVVVIPVTNVLLAPTSRPVLVSLALVAFVAATNLAFFLAAESFFHVSERERDQFRRRYGLVPGGSDPRMVWISTGKGPPRPVGWWLVGRIPGARVWTPGLDGTGQDQERPPDPAG